MHYLTTQSGELLVVYDIPLLFENRAAYEVDYIMIATASSEIQRQRCLSRDGMTESKLESILAKQVPDKVKRENADFVVHTDFKGTFSQARAQTSNALQNIFKLNPDKFQVWMQREIFPGGETELNDRK